jgi:chitinase
MKRRMRIVSALALVLALATAVGVGTGSAAKPGDEPLVVGYYIQWGIYGRGYTVKHVETSGSAAKLDVVNYAFGNVAPNDDGDVVCQSGDPWADYQKPWTAAESVDGTEVTWPRPILGNFQQLKALKALHPGLRVLVSLGGWTWSKHFSDGALTPASRAKLVSSCIDLFIKGNLPDPGWGGMGGPGAAAGVFDGIDLDWEWPGSEGNVGNIIRPEDRQNFTLLVKEFRKQLDFYGSTTTKRHYLLTAFLPAARSKIDAGFEVKEVFKDLDFATVQGYDLHGAWESQTNHQANLFTSPVDPASPRFSVDDVVDAYLERGAPAGKLVVGVPFYSRGWTGVPATGNGLYQPSSGPAPGVWEAGANDYEDVAALLGSGFVRHYDPLAGAAWLYGSGTFWTFDDPAVMQLKAQYVRANGLGGIMFWELSGDTPGGDLIRAIANSLGS